MDVQEMLGGGLLSAYTEAAVRCGVAFETIRRWVSRYCAEGASAFLSPQHNRVYSPVLKEAAVKAYLSGEGSMQKICENTKYVQIINSELGLRCIMVIKTSRSKQEEAV